MTTAMTMTTSVTITMSSLSVSDKGIRVMQGKLSEEVLSTTFKAMDGDKAGEISYPDFTQAMGKLGVAIPGSEAIKLAHQLDYGRSGKIKYDNVHQVLGEAYDRQKVRCLHNTQRMLSVFFAVMCLTSSQMVQH